MVHATEAIALSVIALGGLTIILGAFAIVTSVRRTGEGDRSGSEQPVFQEDGV